MPSDAAPDRVLIELIDTIYEAASSPSNWQTFCVQLQGVFPQASISTLVRDQSARLVQACANVGIDESLVRSYVAHYHQMNCYEPTLAAGHPGGVLRASQIISPTWLRRQAFYNEWLRPAGNLTAGACLIVDRRAEHEIRVAIDLPEAFADAEASSATLLSRLAPHITRAFRLNALMQGEAARDDTITALLQRIRGAAFILDAGRRISALNAAAEGLLKAARLLKADIRGRLAFSNAAAQERFAATVALSAGPALAAPSPFPVTCGDGVRFGVSLLPLRVSSTMAGRGDARMLLVIKPLDEDDPQSLGDLQSLLSLTYRETQVAALVAAGQTVDQISQALGTSTTTVRNQIGFVMAKMGVSRQVEIAARIAQMRITLGRD